jgi:hypothetical protein
LKTQIREQLFNFSGILSADTELILYFPEQQEGGMEGRMEWIAVTHFIKKNQRQTKLLEMCCTHELFINY